MMYLSSHFSLSFLFSLIVTIGSRINPPSGGSFISYPLYFIKPTVNELGLSSTVAIETLPFSPIRTCTSPLYFHFHLLQYLYTKKTVQVKKYIVLYL